MKQHDLGDYLCFVSFMQSWCFCQGYEGARFVLVVEMFSAKSTEINEKLMKLLWNQIEMYSYPVIYMLQAYHMHYFIEVCINSIVQFCCTY